MGKITKLIHDGVVFFTDPVSLETLAEIYEQNKLENVAITYFIIPKLKFYIPLERAFHLLSKGINNLA